MRVGVLSTILCNFAYGFDFDEVVAEPDDEFVGEPDDGKRDRAK